MAWIDMVNEDEAREELGELYRKFRNRQTGRMSHIIKIHSLDPPTMSDHMQLYRRLMFGPSELTRSEREMIGVVVSVENECHY